jgi:ABC-type Fe3+ transport system permease subunit
MSRADKNIALALMGLAIYFMWHAKELPIGWVPSDGPGGGAFPFWLSTILFCSASGVFLSALRNSKNDVKKPFFEPETFSAVVKVSISILGTVAIMATLGTYIALLLFLFWYLRMFGKHSLKLTAIITLTTPVFVFFFFEVTLKILLPKGITEPLFFPLYNLFF